MPDLLNQVAQPPIHHSKRQYSTKSLIDPCPQCGGPKIRKNRICRACRNINAHSPELDETFLVDGDQCRKLPLTKGQYAIVLAEHYAWLMTFMWFVTWNKRSRTFYAGTYDITHKRISLHRMVSGLQKADHKNGDGLDNRPRNLRPCDDSLNGANAQLSLSNKTGYKGVRTDPRRSGFFAAIVYHRKQHWLGNYEQAEDAARRYDVAAIYFFREYARLNFPDERDERVREAVDFRIEKKLLPSTNKSGYRGVSWHIKKGIWIATASLNRKTVIVGYFVDPREAAIARDVKNLELHGDTAVLNFPECIEEYRAELAAADRADVLASAITHCEK
jgi:hypothetical protein